MSDKPLIRAGSRPRDVTLRNITASYSARERHLMRGLTESERWLIHEAKALTGGTLK